MSKKRRAIEKQKKQQERDKKNAHKKGAGYIKPQQVASDEKASGKYRQKLREIQTGQRQRFAGQEEGVSFSADVAEADRSNGARSIEDLFKGIDAPAAPYKEPDVIKTPSYLGPGSVTTRLAVGWAQEFEIPPVEEKGRQFKPTFLVAEKVGKIEEGTSYDRRETPVWQISRYTGLSDNDGKFMGEVHKVAETEASAYRIETALGNWAKEYGMQRASQENYLFPSAKTVDGASPLGFNRRFGL
jgi:hypothetical protein